MLICRFGRTVPSPIYAANAVACDRPACRPTQGSFACNSAANAHGAELSRQPALPTTSCVQHSLWEVHLHPRHPRSGSRSRSERLRGILAATAGEDHQRLCRRDQRNRYVTPTQPHRNCTLLSLSESETSYSRDERSPTQVDAKAAACRYYSQVFPRDCDRRQWLHSRLQALPVYRLLS